MSTCCRPGGWPDADATALLARLAESGLSLPTGARIGGPADGYRWRVLDHRGAEPAMPIRGSRSVAATVGAETVTLRRVLGVVGSPTARRRQVGPKLIEVSPGE